MIQKLVNKNDYDTFHNFYNRLSNKKDIFYMYFSSNLLHYVIESCRLIPDDINLVFIGSYLTNDEVEFINKHFSKPICLLSDRYKDGPIWEMVVQCAEENFGWIDIDCFIFNPALFYELVEIDDDVAVNAIWTRNYYEEYGIDEILANTFIEFLNINALRKVKNKYDVTMQAILYPEYYGNAIMTKEQAEYLTQKYQDTSKRIVNYIDTTHYYQLLTIQEGFRINQIRKLGMKKDYYSSEAIHLGGTTVVHKSLLDNMPGRIYKRFNKRFSYYLLKKNLHILPRQYQLLEKDFKWNLVVNNLETDIKEIRIKIESYLKRFNVNIDI